MERNFWQLIKRHLVGWHLQRIETTTDSGVPDVIAAWQGIGFYMELKNLPATNIQIRKSQWAWFQKEREHKCPALILNRCTKSGLIQVFTNPCLCEIEVTKKNHVKLVSKPDFNILPTELKYTLCKILNNRSCSQ